MMGVYTRLAFAKHNITGEPLYFCKLKRGDHIRYEVLHHSLTVKMGHQWLPNFYPVPFEGNVRPGVLLDDRSVIVSAEPWDKLFQSMRRKHRKYVIMD